MKHLCVAQTALVLRVQIADCLLVWRKVIRPVRAALAVFARVKVEDKCLAKQRKQLVGVPCDRTVSKLFLQKIKQYLTARRSRMAALKQSVLVIVITQTLKKVEGTFIHTQEQADGERILSAVVVDLHHLFHALDAQYIVIGKPLCRQYLVRRGFMADHVVFLSMFIHVGTLQYL